MDTVKKLEYLKENLGKIPKSEIGDWQQFLDHVIRKIEVDEMMRKHRRG